MTLYQMFCLMFKILFIFSYNRSGAGESLTEKQDRKGKLETERLGVEEQQRDVAANIDKLRKDLSTQKVNCGHIYESKYDIQSLGRVLKVKYIFARGL